MKLSMSWLNDYVDVSEFFEKPEELGAMLTRAGLEFEGLENQREQFNNVVIGKIIEKDKHPDADKLTLCKVDIGGKVNSIVCGAKNHKQGDYVVVAMPGALLPGDFKIKPSKIRGVESLGMLCSEKELGLSEESEGIMVLSEGTPGESFAEKFKMNDIILEVSVTPNRADCLSHIGLAREVSCLTGKPWKLEESKLKITDDSTKTQVELVVNKTDECPRYAGRVIKGVQVKESPNWLKQRLESVDINSINNIVDVTNYVMLEMGQPLHAFDLNELAGRKIIVDSSKPKEKFTTLDGTELELTGEELMIRDGNRPVAMAGIIGGLNSGVTEKTTEIFLEAAYFNQKTVRRSSRRFGIDTDSCYRFSRGTDPEGVTKAMNRAVALIQQVAGGETTSDYHDNYPEHYVTPEIEISKSFLEKKLGYSVDEKEFVMWMDRMGCEVSGDAILWKVRPPAFRWDIFIKEDLAEEYARLNGYENIPEALPVLSTEPSTHADIYNLERLVQESLLAEGFQQAMNYHFISSKGQKKLLGDISLINKLGLKTASEPVSVKNPLNEDVDAMRVSLIPGLIHNLIHNERHDNFYGRLYELGACFSKSKDGYEQFNSLSFLVWGQKQGLWQSDDSRGVVFDLKQNIEGLLNRLNIISYEWKSSGEPPSFLHPSQWAELVVEGKSVGFIGTLHPSFVKRNKLRSDIAVSELDWETLMRRQPRVRLFEPISAFQNAERDLAFVMTKDITAAMVVKEIRKAAGKLLSSVDVVDIYEGKGLESGERSVTFKMFFQDEKQTLSEEQLTTLFNKVMDSVTKKLNVRVR